ncbi:MAG: aldehyde dehydrogenase family protein, partial [Actinobacteria bacterium]|nr:aldehyde dehydrogenase family protein [Actinomycetota bacterium]
MDERLLVGGEWIETGEWLDVTSPYSRDVVGRVAKAGSDETRRALDAAEAALAQPLPAHRRAEILTTAATALAERQEEAARIICAEAGKPVK